MADFDALYAQSGGAGDPYDFALRVGSVGNLLAVPQSLRAVR